MTFTTTILGALVEIDPQTFAWRAEDPHEEGVWGPWSGPHETFDAAVAYAEEALDDGLGD